MISRPPRPAPGWAETAREARPEAARRAPAPVAGNAATSGAAGAGADATPDAATGSCSDSILNQDETGVDCGGVCRACACVFGPFSTPEPVTGLGRAGELWGANLSADGRWLAFSELSAGTEDVYLAERDSEAAFLPATAVSGINTAASEGTPSQSGDGLSLYFYAIRGPMGGRDIYVATRLGLEQDYAGARLVPRDQQPQHRAPAVDFA